MVGKRILGISAYYHDSAAALVVGGNILAAAHEERFTRIKHDPSFPARAVEYCLTEAGLDMTDLDAIVFYDKPFLKFERLIETYLYFAPKGFRSFLTSMPIWIKEKLFLRRELERELQSIMKQGALPKVLFSQHHVSHAASAFYPSPFSSAAILTIDGVGEWATASIAKGDGSTITLLKELHFPHSVGLLYSAFTYFLGFVVNSGEYKLMGLAPYGNRGSAQVEHFKSIIYERLITLRDDGSITLNQDFFSYAVGLTMVPNGAWEKLFGFPRRGAKDELMQHHCDLGLAIQQVTEDIVLKMAKHAKDLTGAEYLCMAGGVALNCVANGTLLRSGLYKDIWIQPAAGDAGGALGAALAVSHLYFAEPREIEKAMDAMSGSYLGPAFDMHDAKRMAKSFHAVFEELQDMQSTATRAAELISQGKILGWFQGRMEWGPRALGNRSIVADPRSPDMQKRLNLSIKYREGFRPFAPSVLAEDALAYFEIDRPSPYMLLVADVQHKRRLPLPDDFADRGWKEKLYVLRSDIPSVTHLDYSARLQTVHKETNPEYWALIDAFKRRTGYGVIVNTSFNVRGEPIVCSPEDAYRCFMGTEMDALVVGHLLFLKQDQPPFDGERWRSAYGND